MVVILKTEAEKIKEKQDLGLKVQALEKSVTVLINLINDMNNNYRNLLNDIDRRLTKLEANE